MLKIKKRTQEKKSVLFFMQSLFLMAVVFIVYPQFSFGNNLDLSDKEKEKIEEKEEKVDELEEKAEAYKKIIDLKQKQQRKIDQQITNLDGEISLVENDIAQKNRKIEDLGLQIKDLKKKIKKKKETIEAQKKVLSKLIRAYYEIQNQDMFSIVLADSGLSDFMVGKDRMSQLGKKIEKIMADLKALKASLESQKKSLENKKEEIIETKEELEERNYYLEITKDQKKSLLVQTKGEESKYQDLLARIEEQKKEILGDINNLYAANSSEINAYLEDLPRPSSGLASTNWYYSQKDPRWGDKTIGQSNSLMKDYGCAISAVAMVSTFHGNAITPKYLAKNGTFDWDLIYWPNVLGNAKLTTNTRHAGVNWDTVDRELDKGNPVIVYIRAAGGGGHYVVVHHKTKGKYVVHDPFFGANIYLDSSIKLLERLYKVSISKKSSIDQMILYK